MAATFHGELSELKRQFQEDGLSGTWTEGADKHVFRTTKKGVVTWWCKTGTLQCQGPEPEKQALQDICARIDGSDAVTTASPTAAMSKEEPPKIFVVHGHDHAARDQLELVLRRLGLDPFILMNSAGGGHTIIEALEQEIGHRGRAHFGIVLMTPDDMGYSKKDGEKRIEPRARQNVILETGMLLASLTRKNVAILVKGHLEHPSDTQGIIYFGFNDHLKKVVPKLVERLQPCGFKFSGEQIACASQ